MCVCAHVCVCVGVGEGGHLVGQDAVGLDDHGLDAGRLGALDDQPEGKVALHLLDVHGNVGVHLE